jgi:hypothetical protein
MLESLVQKTDYLYSSPAASITLGKRSENIVKDHLDYPGPADYRVEKSSVVPEGVRLRTDTKALMESRPRRESTQPQIDVEKSDEEKRESSIIDLPKEVVYTPGMQK